MFEQVHKKQKSVREMYAFWCAAGITGIIAAVWIVSLPFRFDGPIPTENITDSPQAGVFSQFISETKNSFTAIFSSSSIASLEEDFDSVESEPSDEQPMQETSGRAENFNNSNNARTGFFLEPRTAGPSQIENTGKKEREIRIETVSEQSASSSSKAQ